MNKGGRSPQKKFISIKKGLGPSLNSDLNPPLIALTDCKQPMANQEQIFLTMDLHVAAKVLFLRPIVGATATTSAGTFV